MRLILAINHKEIQRFIAQNYRLEIAGVAESIDELYELLTYTKADTLIISRYLCKDDDSRRIIEKIKAIRDDLRIIYLYGERDRNTEDFLKYLKSNGISDCHIGTNINSDELDAILFGRKSTIGPRLFGGLARTSRETMWVKELDSAVVTIYSNSSNGKSHLAWSMASELSDRGYKTTLISLDRGNSANIYFGIPDMYYDLLDYMIAEDNYRGIIDNCFKKGALNIITGRLGSETPIKTVDFMKLFNFARSKSNIVIIDTWTGLNEITLQAVSNSNIDFLVFDSDLMHFHLNKQIIEQLDSDFIAEKTYAIINNCNTLSESYKYIYKQISKLKKGFKNIMPLSSCGSLGCDLMHTGRTPYNTTSDYNSSFKKDMDDILKALNTRSSKYGLMQP